MKKVQPKPPKQDKPKGKRSKASKKPTKQQIRERKQNAAYRKLERNLAKVEKEGFKIDRAALLASRDLKRNKRASDKSIERVSSYTPDKIKQSKFVSYKGFTGAKGLSLKKWDDFFNKIGSTTEDSEGKEIYSKLRKPEKVEQWKNPMARKKLVDSETGEKIPNKVKLPKDFNFAPPVETHVSEPETPELTGEDNIARGALDELAKELEKASELMPSFKIVLENLGLMIGEIGYKKTFDILSSKGAFNIVIAYGYSEELRVMGQFMKNFVSWVQSLQDTPLLEGGLPSMLRHEFDCIGHYAK